MTRSRVQVISTRPPRGEYLEENPGNKGNRSGSDGRDVQTDGTHEIVH